MYILTSGFINLFWSTTIVIDTFMTVKYIYNCIQYRQYVTQIVIVKILQDNWTVFKVIIWLRQCQNKSPMI